MLHYFTVNTCVGEGWVLGPDFTVNIGTAINGGRNYVIPATGWSVFNATTEAFDEDNTFKITGLTLKLQNRFQLSTI